MTKKDLFKIIIKLFGLYVAIEVFVMIPDTIFSLIYNYDPISIKVNIVTLFVFLSILYILIFRADFIIKLFRLEKGFDNEIVSNNQFESKSIVKVSIVIIAFFCIVDSIPDVVTNLFYAFKNSVRTNSLETLTDIMISKTKVDYYVLTTSSIRLLLGFLILTNKNSIVKKIEN